MANAPQIALLDGSGFTTNLVFTTNLEAITITGTVDPSTVALQVSVNGAPFVSDPSLVQFTLPKFSIPNPSVMPDGLLIALGVNTIQIRTIDLFGSVSATSTVTVTRLQVISQDIGSPIPTGIRVRRKFDSVDIMAAKPGQFLTITGIPINTTFLGFNFYASTSAGGATGYFKINQSPVVVSQGIFEQDNIPLANESTTWASIIQKVGRIRVTEEDEFGRELAVHLDKIYDFSTATNNLIFTSQLQDSTLQEFLFFNHNRAGGAGILNSDQFTSVASTDPLYYVVTSVFFDPATNTQVESPYSQEVLGTPLIIDTTIRDLPLRVQRNIQVDYIRAIQRVNTEISLIPGSTTRDVSIDPFCSEAERLYFVLDFVHRSQSFLTLLQIDDANGDGVSDPVVSSAYKQALKAALGITADATVQTLIDTQFDKLASNCAITRLPGRPSIGQVIFATIVKPNLDKTIPSGIFVTTNQDATNGIPSIRYRVGGSFVLSAANADAFYNFDTKQYEVTADITAEVIGEVGNRPAGQIKNVQGLSGFTVTNREATVFGQDHESNSDLAARAQLAFVSVDTGTQGGYELTAASQVGILKAKVVKSGDPLMMRDYDDVRKKHIGGKVDIWIQGLLEKQVSEVFAFVFDIANDMQVQLIDLPTLTFRTLDPRVTPNTPLVEILDNSPQGLGVHNVTTGQDYDLTGVVIVDYQTFRVNTSISQPATHLDDIIVADYRFRSINQFVFTQQPVRRVVSVVGEVSGALNSTLGFSLFKPDDPLLDGESTIAANYLNINQVSGIPSGNTITVNNEVHVLIGSSPEPILSVGINTDTLKVFNSTRTTQYAGPDSPDPDYDILNGTPTTPIKIVRTSTSTIPNGSSVSIDYIKNENFTVTYVVNDLIQQLQKVINVKRHITADVLVKQSVQNSIDLQSTVQLLLGATKDSTDPGVRTSVSTKLDTKLIGQGAAQSDVIQSIDSSSGVDFLIVPMAKMAYADGSQKLRESLVSSAIEMTSLALGGNRVFILTEPLLYPTTDGGGLSTEHKGVFQDDEALVLSGVLSTVGSSPDQAFIIGNAGALITGYTDSATLTTAGFVTPATQQAELLRRTANHVLVSLSGAGAPPDSPANHTYSCSYIIRGDSGAHDITASSVESITLGNFTLTYRTAT